MRWAGHTACIGDKRNTYRRSVENLREGGYLGSADLEWTLISKCMLKETGSEHVVEI
jgi:hypothetical protein